MDYLTDKDITSSDLTNRLGATSSTLSVTTGLAWPLDAADIQVPGTLPLPALPRTRMDAASTISLTAASALWRPRTDQVLR